MERGILNQYARLLVQYSLDLQPEEKLLIKSSALAEDLVREVYREALKAGAHVTLDLSIREQGKIFMDEAGENQLQHISPIAQLSMESCDAYLYIRAPYNLKEEKNVDPRKIQIRQEAARVLNDIYFDRLAKGTLKRSLCQFPTLASAQEAGMSLEEYENFVYTACKLNEPDPVQAWLNVRAEQQQVVDYLNSVSQIRYLNSRSDITFSVKERIWINSDGRNNMPSGEVFTAPIEDSVNGHIYFDYPSIYMGQEVRGIQLEVRDGKIIKWDAEQGKDFLDHIFGIKGANYFGEAAIGTNYSIQQPTKNILFDEKIGGTVHMAVGQSYKQCGGKNESAIHWDMIADMKHGGQIFADGTLIYENGRFTIFS